MNDNKNKELDRLNGVYKKLLANAKVDYHEGFGTVVDAHTVEVNGQQFTVSNASPTHLVEGAFAACGDDVNAEGSAARIRRLELRTAALALV